MEGYALETAYQAFNETIRTWSPFFLGLYAGKVGGMAMARKRVVDMSKTELKAFLKYSLVPVPGFEFYMASRAGKREVSH